MANLHLGMRVHVVHAPYKITRTWWDRLFTIRPWRPFKKYKHYTDPMWEMVKDNEVYYNGNDMFVNPEVFSELKKIPGVNPNKLFS